VSLKLDKVSELWKLDLVLLVNNFGYSFSGGSSATTFLLEHLQANFRRVIVICQNIGRHKFNDLTFVTYKSESEIPNLLKQIDPLKSIGYSDFYLGKYWCDFSVPFFFTYHDNWPEISQFEDKGFGDIRIKEYSMIFENASHVFSVSDNKTNFIKNYSANYTVVRNGLTQSVVKTSYKSISPNEPIRIIMAGNIDKRKYGKCIDVFSVIEKRLELKVEVDIYGHINNTEIATRLQKFGFVNLKGFISKLSFADYHLLLCTSLMENLSLSVVDAIANHTAVIAFDVGGLGEIVNNYNGDIIPPYDIGMMVDAIEQLYTKKLNIDPLTKIEDFNWKRSANKMVNIIANELNLKP